VRRIDPRVGWVLVALALLAGCGKDEKPAPPVDVGLTGTWTGTLFLWEGRASYPIRLLLQDARGILTGTLEQTVSGATRSFGLRAGVAWADSLRFDIDIAQGQPGGEEELWRFAGVVSGTSMGGHFEGAGPGDATQGTWTVERE
jgi:hypothetical protein